MPLQERVSEREREREIEREMRERVRYFPSVEIMCWFREHEHYHSRRFLSVEMMCWFREHEHHPSRRVKREGKRVREKGEGGVARVRVPDR